MQDSSMMCVFCVRIRGNSGMSLLSAIVVLCFLAMMSMSLVQISAADADMTGNHIDMFQAERLADSGLEWAQYRLGQCLSPDKDDTAFSGGTFRVVSDAVAGTVTSFGSFGASQTSHSITATLPDKCVVVADADTPVVDADGASVSDGGVDAASTITRGDADTFGAMDGGDKIPPREGDFGGFGRDSDDGDDSDDDGSTGGAGSMDFADLNPTLGGDKPELGDTLGPCVYQSGETGEGADCYHDHDEDGDTDWPGDDVDSGDTAGDL